MPLLADGADATIVSARWSRTAGAPDRVAPISGQVAPGPVYLGVTVRGGRAALDALSAAGKLPIRAKWFWTSFGRSVADANADLIDAVNLSIGRKDKIAALALELRERGFFDWRTWSGKQNARPGRWKVKLVFADNTPVPCSPAVSCEFTIDVASERAELTHAESAP